MEGSPILSGKHNGRTLNSLTESENEVEPRIGGVFDEGEKDTFFDERSGGDEDDNKSSGPNIRHYGATFIHREDNSPEHDNEQNLAEEEEEEEELTHSYNNSNSPSHHNNGHSNGQHGHGHGHNKHQVPAGPNIFKEFYSKPKTWRSFSTLLRSLIFNRETLTVLIILLIFGFMLYLFVDEPEVAKTQGLLGGLSRTSNFTSPIYPSSSKWKQLRVKVVTPEYHPPDNERMPFINFTCQHLNAISGLWTDTPKENWELRLEESTLEKIHQFKTEDNPNITDWRIVVFTSSEQPIGIEMKISRLDWMATYQVLIGIIILVAVYSIIVFEWIHRTIAALLGSFWALAIVSRVHEKPDFIEVIEWIDFDTIGLLFGMMVMVGIFSETGFFEWVAIKAYKVSKGNLFRLTMLLCVATAVFSCFLDNVTTILLLGPVTIRLCRVIDVDPIPVIIFEVIWGNIGGAATAVGDPPNILIVNDPKIKRSGLVDFGTFAMHVAPGIAFALCIVSIFMFIFFRKRLVRTQNKSKAVKEIEIWQRTAESIFEVQGDEEQMVKKKLQDYIKQLQLKADKEKQFQQNSSKPSSSSPTTSLLGNNNNNNTGNNDEDEIELDFEANYRKELEEQQQQEQKWIEEMEKKYVIQDMNLFIKTNIVLFGVVICFFLHSFVHIGLDLAWIAIIGALVLIIVSNVRNISQLLLKVELPTLVFFAGLFVLMKSLSLLGVMDFIADLTADIIEKVPEGRARLAAAVVLIIWVGAIVGACIDNIPFTQTMIPVVTRLAERELGLPLTPLVWALAYGVCLGGNGTLVGASANVVAAGICEGEGHPISFVRFFLYGFPFMIISVSACTVYMLIFHVLVPWHESDDSAIQ
eukprot:TRINITY_DN259_c0_g1_i1.p1 TRINITY_DN259_c0_g1~~TRINITY_DN259_c0_g1_i1.p1  ORF type:complete len:864 (-),score=214.53 TRINITY_DN259_c0_g1_i1:31-2622(-)